MSFWHAWVTSCLLFYRDGYLRTYIYIGNLYRWFIYGIGICSFRHIDGWGLKKCIVVALYLWYWFVLVVEIDIYKWTLLFRSFVTLKQINSTLFNENINFNTSYCLLGLKQITQIKKTQVMKNSTVNSLIHACISSSVKLNAIFIS